MVKIILLISVEDEEWLKERLPKEYVLNVHNEEKLVSTLLANFRGVKGTPDPQVVANMMKIMAIAVENKNILHENVLDKNLSL